MDNIKSLLGNTTAYIKAKNSYRSACITTIKADIQISLYFKIEKIIELLSGNNRSNKKHVILNEIEMSNLQLKFL